MEASITFRHLATFLNDHETIQFILEISKHEHFGRSQFTVAFSNGITSQIEQDRKCLIGKICISIIDTIFLDCNEKTKKIIESLRSYVESSFENYSIQNSHHIEYIRPKYRSYSATQFDYLLLSMNEKEFNQFLSQLMQNKNFGKSALIKTLLYDFFKLIPSNCSQTFEENITQYQHAMLFTKIINEIIANRKIELQEV